MKRFDLAQSLSVLANLGVIAGILFLAIEIRQTNTIASLNARATEIDQYNNWRFALVEDDVLLEVWMNGLAGTLSDPLDQEKFRNLCLNYVWMAAAMWERGETLDRPAVVEETVAIRGRMLRDSVGFQACWDYAKGSVIGYGLSEFVDQVENFEGE